MYDFISPLCLSLLFFLFFLQILKTKTNFDYYSQREKDKEKHLVQKIQEPNIYQILNM